MNTFLGLPFTVWGLICLAVAVLYAFIYPRQNEDTRQPPRSPAVQFVLRWFHSIVWLLLASTCFILVSGPSSLANSLAYLALFLYVVFIITLILDRRNTP
jgi:hypothetical protein